MNKSKKYKYLRKNRHSKRITRKVQKGGQPGRIDNEELIAKIQEAALKENKNKQIPNDEVPGIIDKAKAWFIYKFTPSIVFSQNKSITCIMVGVVPITAENTQYPFTL